MRPNRRPFLRLSIMCGIVALVLSGCSSLAPDSSYRYVHPRVAVFRFENKAPRGTRWNIGDGMADMMVTCLMKARRFTVIERENLPAILKELDFQRTGKTREEGKIPHQRIMNVQYLIKGTITDFSHIGRGGISIGTDSTYVGGRGSTALVSMVITVIDVESGEILLSTTSSRKVRARGLDVGAAYKDVSFGGQAFYRTPLGKATQKAMNRAIREVVDVIGSRKWQPVIIEVKNNRVVLNGGRDRRLRVGALYHVMRHGEKVYDTETGNLLGTTPGRRIGVVEVTELFDKFSYAGLREGELGEVGFRLQKLSRKESVAFRKGQLEP